MKSIKNKALKPFLTLSKGEDGGRHQVQLDGGPESDRREACADDPSTIQNLQR